MSTEETSIELSEEKSEELAHHIRDIHLSLFLIDLPYMKAVAKAMRKRAHFRMSAAALNPRYEPKADELLMQQANTLSKLCEYVEALKETTRLKNELGRTRQAQSELEKMFA